MAKTKQAPTLSSSNSTAKTAKEKVKDFIKGRLAEAEKFNERKPELESEAEERISYAKTKLMKLEPFFAILLFKMPTYPNYDIETAGTDGTVLIYNPKWIVESILRKDLVFILYHEIGHIFFKHTTRGPIRSINANKILQRASDNRRNGIIDAFLDLEVAEMKHKLKEWNFATDFVINGHGKEHTNIPVSKELEKHLLINKDYTDHTSEYIYDKIKTPFDPEEIEGGMGLGIGGILPQGFGELSDDEVSQLESEFGQEVEAAAISAARAGKLPQGISDIIESLYKTETPWQDVFRTIFTSISKQDYTFMYPNKRYTTHMMDYGVVMPSLFGEEYTDCGFIMDTSGSVGKKEKEILTSELRNILEDYKIRLHVLYCDTKAYTKDVQILTQDDIRNGKLKLNVKGGGGTCMRPAFDYFRDNQEEHNFQIVICMTDMGLFDWGQLGPTPEFSVYWACLPEHDASVVPDFGTKINISVSK